MVESSGGDQIYKDEVSMCQSPKRGKRSWEREADKEDERVVRSQLLP